MRDEPPNDHIPGSWYGPWSLVPALEVAAFVSRADDWTKERRAAAGSSVFKAHPGLRSVMITDMAGLEFVFGASVEDLDRLDDDDPGFGGLSFNRREMLDGVVPALIAHGTHDAARAIVVEAIRIRRAAFGPACRRVFDYGLPMLRVAAPGEGVDFKDALHQAAVSICFEWLFGISPGPTGRQAKLWLQGCFGLKADAPLANALARRVSRLKNGPSAEMRRHSQTMMEAIRRSDPYPAFVDAAHRVGLPEQDLAGHLLFAAGFNGTAGAWATLFPAMSQVYTDEGIRARLAAELVDFRGDLFELDRLPYLHDFFLESMRLYGRPRHYYRRARRDLVLPVSEGQPVPVAQGTTLCVMATVARQDRTVWGEDASVFDPGRYARRPELRERVFPFGPPPTAPNPFGCVGAASGVASVFWKSIAGGLARDTRWRLTPWPEPDVDAFDGVIPSALTWWPS